MDGDEGRREGAAGGRDGPGPPRGGGRRRRRSAAGQERGAATRARLIDAGLRCFGSDGFDATTTRALAAEAGVNLAAIPYHFGGKDGLYLAVADHIAGRIRERLGPLLEQVKAVTDDGPDAAEEAAELIVEIVAQMARTLLSDEAALWAPIVLREQMAPSAAFDRLFEGGIRHVGGAIARLLSQCMGRPLAPDEAAIRALALIGQAIAFRASHAAVLRQLGIERMDAAHAEQVVAVVREHARAIVCAAGSGEIGQGGGR